MKKNIFFLLFSFILFSTQLTMAQKTTSFSDRWKKVEELAKKQLPESAIKEVETILQDAQKAKNFSESVKAYVYKMRFTLDKKPDEAPAILKEFETFAKSYTLPEEKALLHSMSAELYAMYYRGQQYTINQRTQLQGYVPDNINEWSKNLFFDKISSELKLSLESPAVLQKADLTKFSALIEKGKDGSQYQPTLFDFLGQRAVSILVDLNNIALIKNPLYKPEYFAAANEFIKMVPEKQFAESNENQIIWFYQQLLAFRLTQDNIPALLFIDLQRLDYLRNNSQLGNAGELYISSLEKLQEQYASNEAVIPVAEKMAEYYLSQSYTGNEEDNTYKRTAYEIADKTIRRFSNSKQTNGLKNIQAQITQKNITVNYPAVKKPGKEITVEVNSSNIKDLELNIYQVNASAEEYHLFKQNNRGYEQKPYPGRKSIDSKSLSFVSDKNYGSDKNEFKFTLPEYGIYEFDVLEKGSTVRNQQAHGTITITDLAFIQRSKKKNENEVYVLDRMNGNPVQDVNVKIKSLNWNGNKYTITDYKQDKTDKTGLFTLTTERYNYVYFLSKGNDRYFSSEASSYYYGNSEKQVDKPQLDIFSDRSLYRPGQTVYFKGIAYLSQKQEVVKNASYEVKLMDANRQEISKKSFKTNEFGSFSGEFILPDGGLNGAYTLQSDNFYLTIYVEEYKRPTFEVKIEKPEKEVYFGEKVSFNGNVKAYAGYAVPDAQINYTVKRRNHYLFWWFPRTPEQVVANGIASSDANGNFEISFVPERTNNSTPVFRDQFYTYTLEANVTDAKGETQQGVQTISVGDKSLFIVSQIAEMYDKQDEIKLAIHTETLNGKVIISDIQYKVYQLEAPTEYRENLKDLSKLKENKQILSGVFNTDKKTLSLNLKSFPSGYYKIVLSTSDAKGKEVKTESVFVLYDAKEKQPPVKTYVWLLTPKVEVKTGEKAEIRLGTSASNTSVLYEIMRGNTVLESRWIILNNETKTFEVPLKKEYGEGVNVLFTFVKDEQVFTRTVQVKQKTEEKKLTPALSVFRDKLKPGENAEWTVTIPEAENAKTIAELLIGMYDASLDAIRPHSWIFNPSYRLFIPYSYPWSGVGFNQGYGYGNFEIKTENTTGIYLNQLKWFGLNITRYSSGGGPVWIRGTSSRKSSNLTGAVQQLEMVEDQMDMAVMPGLVVQHNTLNEEEIVSYAPEAGGPKAGTEPEIQIRSNFNETAFFYPQLRTDHEGNIRFTFTAPESLTRWNVKMLAHTPELYFGQSEQQVVTQKELMVQLNMPRFVRRSDKLVLVANVMNLTENTLVTDVNLELIDPETGKTIPLKDNKTKTVTLDANGTKPVEWSVSEFSAYELVTVKVTAQSGSFNDGEQHYLPVLPDKVLLTESMPMTIRGNQTRDFSFESLLSQGKNVDSKSLTVEFAANPTWYAVQALPTLSAPDNENAIDYFTAYYVNGLASYIANSDPKIATIFDRWKRESGSREALLSNLEKNTELKNMLLEETPWVLNAKDETEQKRQIALLFDLNQQKNQGEQYLDKLIKLQKSSGGFSWFDGMSENRYITQQILLGMAYYNEMTKPAGDTPEWIVKALEYTDLQIARDLDNLKKYNKNYKTTMVIHDMQWFYLHMRSEYKNIPVHKSAKEAVDFYTSQAEKYWTQGTLYGKAATALICYRNGKTTLANDILKSLKENAMKTDELGMYWARNMAGYFWNERPISVQTTILEAFAEITNNASDMDEMKIWLLKQKQTQRWDSPISTVDAVYALLNYGTDWLASEGQVEIKMNNKVLEPASKEAGTGYFKETIPAVEIQPKMGNVTVKKSDEGIGWGAMYWQYYQDMDKVQQHGSALSVTKKLFVEKTVDNKTTMLPVEQSAIKKGDKIITRLVITTDRDLEFVALKDLRAACFEPVDQRSGIVWREGVAYYETIKDASTQFFFNFLPKGNYVFEYEVWANNTGDFASGMATVQCQYAPEFISHSGGERITIE